MIYVLLSTTKKYNNIIIFDKLKISWFRCSFRFLRPHQDAWSLFCVILVYKIGFPLLEKYLVCVHKWTKLCSLSHWSSKLFLKGHQSANLELINRFWLKSKQLIQFLKIFADTNLWKLNSEGFFLFPWKIVCDFPFI